MVGLSDMVGASELLNVGIRKAAHLTEYAVLTVVAYGAAVIGLHQTKRRPLQLALACAVLFAISDEWHQRFVPSRTSTFQDVCIDLAGACIAIVVIMLVRSQHQKSASH